jgi:hypothetical protein
MKRGDLVTVILPGAYGKPRPAVIVQSDRYEAMESITFLPMTSEVLPKQVFRITVVLTAQKAYGRRPRSWQTSAVHCRWPGWAAYSGVSALPISEGSIEHSQLSWVSLEKRLRCILKQ